MAWLKKNYMTVGTAIGMAAVIAFVIYGIHIGIFTSKEKMEAFIRPFGIWGPLVFVLIQVVQVVLPVIPGGISCLGGVLLFGPFYGFLYNYIGICIGSLFAFLLARRYGRDFVIRISGQRIYDKYIGWLDRGKKFDIGFALAIFFPMAPDDFLCYLAGLTHMSVQRFTAIILLAKPASIAIYSAGLSIISSYLFRFIQ